jgi:hypothetical protein
MYVNGKMVSAETFPGMGGERRVKKSSGGGEFKQKIFDTL